MSTTIAIDFGTSRTKLAYLDSTTGRPELMRLGQRDDPFIPSLFYLERDSERIFIGDDAEAMLEQDPAGVVEILKRKLHESHVRANRRRVTPVELLARLLAELRNRAGREIAAFEGRLADAVHLTVPAIYGPSLARLLREAAGQAGFTNVELVPEPVAAARAWLAHANGAAAGIVVFDCGGGTIDWAYLRRDGEAYRLVPECPPGGDAVGGHDLDRELLARLEDRLEEDAILAGVRGHETALLQAIRVIKERYCRGLPVPPMRIGDCEARLSPSDLESVFAARFIDHASAGLKGYLAQVRAISGSDQPPVLLVGGSARVTGLREALERECGCETLWWERAAYATVLGAVPGQQERSRVPSLLGGRYRDHGDGTVTDVTTGLQWMRCALGQHWEGGTCVGEAGKFKWKQAQDAAEALNRQGGYAGHRDWRLPTKDELLTLVHCSSGQPKTWNDTGLPCTGYFQRPTIYQPAFPNTPADWFWSGSETPVLWGLLGARACLVYFNDGGVLAYYQSATGLVRLVRSGQ